VAQGSCDSTSCITSARTHDSGPSQVMLVLEFVVRKPSRDWGDQNLLRIILLPAMVCDDMLQSWGWVGGFIKNYQLLQARVCTHMQQLGRLINKQYAYYKKTGLY